MHQANIRISLQCGVKNRICVFANSRANRLVKKVPGYTWVPKRNHFHVPQTLHSCRELIRLFGENIEVSDEVREWAKSERRHERIMAAAGKKTVGSLGPLWDKLPALAQAIHIGPRGRQMTPEEQAKALEAPGSYQAADVAFLAQSRAPINGNEQGLGKTVEWIAAVWESGLEKGDHLIICPTSAIDGTWLPELLAWQEGADIEVFPILGTQAQAKRQLAKWKDSKAATRWVIINHEKMKWIKYRRVDDYDIENMSDSMLESIKKKYGLPPDATTDDILLAQLDALPRFVRMVKGAKKDEACRCEAHPFAHEHYSVTHPSLFDTEWSTVCVDEVQLTGLKNPSSIMADTFKSIQCKKSCLMTGTPMSKLGGSDIYGLLKVQNESFSSRWTFYESYYEIEKTHFGKSVGNIRRDRLDDLKLALAPYMLRRKKVEVFNELPEKLYIEVPCEMGREQSKQYTMMEEEFIAMFEDAELVAAGVLAQRTRLKQFANSLCRFDDDEKIIPVKSPKVDALIEKMFEVGIHEPGDDVGYGKHLIFSRSRGMVDFTSEKLTEKGIENRTITGSTTSEERKKIIRDFQHGSLPAIVIVTKAGGFSLTLDMADTVHLLDESESPGDDEQAEDRAHRVSRIHMVTVFIYRTKGTIDYNLSLLKAAKNKSFSMILDQRRSVTSPRGSISA